MLQHTVGVIVLEAMDEVGEALQRWLNAQPGVHCHGRLRSVLMLQHAINEFHPDVVIMDVHCGGLCNLGTVRDLAELGEAARVVILSSADAPEEIAAALAAGAYGFVSRLDALEDLYKAVLSTADGKVFLSTFAQRLLAVRAVGNRRLADTIGLRRSRFELPAGAAGLS